MLPLLLMSAQLNTGIGCSNNSTPAHTVRTFFPLARLDLIPLILFEVSVAVPPIQTSALSRTMVTRGSSTTVTLTEPDVGSPQPAIISVDYDTIVVDTNYRSSRQVESICGSWNWIKVCIVRAYFPIDRSPKAILLIDLRVNVTAPPRQTSALSSVTLMDGSG